MKIGNLIYDITRYSDNCVKPTRLDLPTILNEFRYMETELAHMTYKKLEKRLYKDILVDLYSILRNELEN